MKTSPQDLTARLARAQRPVFLTGAGVSTESGIPDFRSPDGLYANGGGEWLFDIHAFRQDPSAFYRAARRLFDTLRQARPNPGHAAIAALSRRHGKAVSVVTQNIDVLHQQAGSPVVLPVHGTLETCTCQVCGAQMAGDGVWERVHAGEIPPRHECGGVLKPDIVFFGEALPVRVFAAAEDAIRAADLVVVAGTSLVVYPAAGLPGRRCHDCGLVIINRTPTDLDPEADLLFRDSTATVLAAAVEGLG